MASIIFNGKSYSNIEEMPANERQAYEQMMSMFVDKNGNGIPDFLEGDIVKNVLTSFTSSVNFNGQTYNGMNELPEDVRQKIQDAYTKMSEFGLISAGTSPVMAQLNKTADQKSQVTSRPFISREYNPAIQEESSSSWMTWILIGAVLALCLAVAVFAVFYVMNQ